MRPDAIVIGGVLLALAGGAFLVVWLQKDDIVQETRVEGLAGPQAPSTPPALAPASSPAPAPPQSVPRPLALLFDFDRAVLRAAEAKKLERLLQAARDSGFKRIEAAGHADRIGPAAYNMKLSARRAAAVKAYLAEKNVDPGAVRTSAKGELEAATGDACLDMGPEVRGNAGLVECLQADRRVEVTVIGGL
jgi:OOP family OmpA-OmpF porin